MSAENVTIYAGNLNYNTTQETLKASFSKFGEVVDARIITAFFRGQRRSRGFGFVQFKDANGFNAAVNNKDALEIDQFKVRIVAAKPRVVYPKDTVFLGNIPENTTENDIREAFKGFNIAEVRIPVPRNSNAPARHFAFVKFETEEVQKQASAPKNVSLKGQEIPIRLARPARRRIFRGRRRQVRRAPKAQ
ncbi:RNA-binding protein [Tritrichomonas foetus]|uniref:RNA-binding protein n=1 Tax=Tritrichomonas foetus TaxID=1144522 RepID=A0A1J4KZH9_9EUKA|nr:rNA-binding protein [Tritrichomonas foetus]ARM19962.1 rNA-binding protein [Tritrichomonas foetus]OHT14989.1 RNA-binding protein [Tritrichomonas foetus]OHT14997.1 RNA-binding protein [Tritrichomonas foetus]|eukprot:OHT14989.1 RNA-binding protein [Tritrichomonas foetus]